MPEGINRIVTDHVSDMLLASTESAVANLTSEGCAVEQIHLVGDVMCDVTPKFADRGPVIRCWLPVARRVLVPQTK